MKMHKIISVVQDTPDVDAVPETSIEPLHIPIFKLSVFQAEGETFFKVNREDGIPKLYHIDPEIVDFVTDLLQIDGKGKK